MIQIERHKIYESHGYKFKNFVSLTDEEKRMVLKWRNHKNVRSMMINSDIISLKDHLRFIDSLNERNDCYYWLVFNPNNIPIGVMDILHVDLENDTGEFGNYLNPEESGNGFDFLIECNYFLFGVLKLGNNILTVNVKNKEVLLFVKYLGGGFETTETIGDETYYINRHGNGTYILTNYDNLSLLDYAKFVRKNKNNIIFNI